jgi:predicted nuclease of predicted toxin-antitoxin system
MKVWVDAQLSPSIAVWIRNNYPFDSHALRELGLRDAEDETIFTAARKADAILLTKDSDFIRLLERFGPPPSVILLTCGNTSNANLKRILTSTLENAIRMLTAGEQLVEIG